MKILKTSLVALAAAFALSSCDSDGGKETVQYTYRNNVTYVNDVANNTSVATDAATYVVEYDFVSAKAKVEIKDLRLSENATPMNLLIQNASFGYSGETGSTIITLPNAVSVVGGETHTISNFKLSQTVAYLNALGGEVTYYSISFLLDNQYTVTAVQTAAVLPGTTIVANNDGNILETTSRPYYSYVLDSEKKTATLTAYGLRVEGVTYASLSFENLPYTLTPTGISINIEDDVTAKQLNSSGEPLVAKALSMDSKYDASTQIRIQTANNLVTASLSYRVQQSTPSN
ncbi:MAG: hypothetical protein HDS54_08225 [Barnesiella sp.]|nr:hypothetical protein [Barnesiella sp.]